MYKVIVVDDKPIIRKSIVKSVNWDIYNCICIGEAGDGVEAIEIIEKELPDLVITDIKMPEVDGLDLSKYLKNNHPKTKVIMITGYDEFEYAQSALRIGVLDLILKPIDQQVLYGSIKKAVDLIKREEAEEKIRQQIQEEKILLEKEIKNYKQSNSEVFDINKCGHIVKKAIQFIEKEYAGKLSLEQVSQKVNVTPTYLSRLIKKEMGKSFVEVITEVRMVKAKQLLKVSTNKIYEVGNQVGFENYAYFYQLFKKHFNMTPKQFKNKYGK